MLQPNMFSANPVKSAREESLHWAHGKYVINCNAAISACEKGIEWEKTLRLLQEMPCRGLQPDMSSYGAAVIAVASKCEL